MAPDDNLSKPASVPPTTVSAAQFLIDRINYERTNDIPYGKREFKLERMKRLLEHLGDPQEVVRVIHVAGSKGKGSTATIIASILTEAGLRTGLYTSPHLLRLEERFRIDGEEIAAQQLGRLVQSTIRPVVARLDEEALANGQPWDTPTFFEITTAAAMVYFREQKVDAAVLEVGLGGRLDSTNICRPECCVITSISLDHTKQLGSTHPEIASEKAGILKVGVPLVTGVTHPEALATISAAARSLTCPQWTIQKDFGFDHHTSEAHQSLPRSPTMDFALHDAARNRDPYQLAALTLDDLQLGMWGEHQAANAAVAVMVAHVLRSKDENGWQIPNEAIRAGLRKAICPARIELVSDNPRIIVDTAHNLASMQALTATLDLRFSDLSPAQRIVVFATSKGKYHREMLELLEAWAGRLILTKYQENPRGVPIEQLQEELRGTSTTNGAEVFTAETPANALESALQLADSDSLVCVTGSFFLAAEVLAVLRGSSNDV